MAERFLNNENHGRLRDRIDKGIVPVDHSQRAHNDLPPPLRPDRPLDPNPHGHALGPPRASPPARAELGKLGDAQRAGMQEYLDRK
jgi:hypothetical protein